MPKNHLRDYVEVCLNINSVCCSRTKQRKQIFMRRPTNIKQAAFSFRFEFKSYGNCDNLGTGG